MLINPSHGGIIFFPPEIASGKRLHFATLKMAIEIVDLPMKNGDFP